MARAMEGPGLQHSAYLPELNGSDMAEKGKEQVKRLANAGSEKVLGTLDSRKGELAKGIRGFADLVEKVSHDAPQAGIPEPWIRSAVQTLRSFSERIESGSSQELWQDAQSRFRQRPGVFMAGLA